MTVDGAWTCDRCGAEAPPDAQRCRNCGAWLPAYDEGQDTVTRGWRRHWPGAVFARPKPPPPPLPVGTLHGSGSVEGVACNVQVRTEVRGSGGNTGTVIVCNFRVEVYDRRGRPVGLVPVEMRGDSFDGAVNDGDRVRVEGKARRGTLRVKRLYNLTTGAEVSTGGTHWGVALLVLLVFTACMIFIFFFAGR
ncbi:hypothetical protein [Streptomyces sp. MZ04]|uniref:hypothetical protein n=1 Tax=Streptomyces sp. MZ04 TaxID=2559236 RepID=UPI00107E9617|nr:hypothetical protein [Streptomyces sp. MZ04]TGB09613.1 hypothetical protein E2651_15900 [Streptomyces sp. MZ04]